MRLHRYTHLPRTTPCLSPPSRPLNGLSTQRTTPSWAFSNQSHASCAQHKRHFVAPSPYPTTLQRVMETVNYSDETAGASLRQKFCLFRELSKLVDLRTTAVKSHSNGGNFLKSNCALFSIVEAAISYAYTGSIAISAANVTRIYLLAHSLGSTTIVEWCVDFLRTRTCLDNVAEVWSVANATVNRELVELHFEISCLRGETLMQTTARHFEVLLEKICQGGVSEETKFQAISKWLDGGRKGCDAAERADLSKLSPVSQTEFWKFVRKYSEWIASTPHSASNRPPRCKEVLMITGRDTTSESWILKSVPQLQPDKAFNVEVPGHKASTVLNGNCYAFNHSNPAGPLWSVNYRNGCITEFPFKGQQRSWYSVAARNESIFIFGGHTRSLLEHNCVPTCERVDTATGEFTLLPDMPSARRSTSALNIPDIGILVVGGQKREERLKSAEMLVEDPSGESGWRWIELNPMLEARNEPGIAYFNGCVVVAGGQEGQPKITVECLRLTFVEHPTAPQWTRLHESFRCSTLEEQNTQWTLTSIFSFSLATSGWLRGDAHELLPTGGDTSLANSTWKRLFRVDNLRRARIVVTSERLDGS
ncbi:hypothetical protein EGR_08186 [Echinococcus granulosus]|uniref:Uncharacterized protein n=1 Tax=Echinococcus granulosus TaxID=6210 RepID=W6UUA4_ECHGR|nr:hypothetical protein EGR_08186 [Echinococcus granulosus]EUB56949.1 hypothetical protein EGR_08186 [Echinococcus granulosus]